MAHLFRQKCGLSWQVSPLDADANDIPRDGDPSTGSVASSQRDSAPVILRHRVAERSEGVWILLVPRGLRVRVNGILDRTGIRVLRDRDEIVAEGAGRLFFSTEERRAVIPFPETAEPTFCARRRQAIVPGTPAVRCGCGLWHHESTELPCWTYADRCSGCPAPTDLDGGFRWSPEEL